jgi:hypothetical protein
MPLNNCVLHNYLIHPVIVLCDKFFYPCYGFLPLCSVEQKKTPYWLYGIPVCLPFDGDERRKACDMFCI